MSTPTDGVARAAAEAAAQAAAQKSGNARAAAAQALKAQLAAAARVAANRATAQKLSVERSAALADALTRSQSAQAVLNTAHVDLESRRASQVTAQGRVSLVHRLAVEASTTAAASTRSFAALARKLAQQQSGAVVADVFLGGHSLSNMLDQLSTLDQLNHVTENIQTIQARAQADTARAVKLNQQDAETRTAASTASVDASQATLDAATSDFEIAGLALVTAASQAATAAATLAALGVRPITLTDVGQLSDQGWANPAHGAISDAYGPRPVRPIPGVGAFHFGTDIGASCKSPVLAATAGIVRAASALGSYGNWILIDHGAGVETGYAHLAAGDTLVAVGDHVAAGQQIASVGSTGLSTGCHTHIEVRVDGVRVNPQPFFLNRGVDLGN
ncbi:M23 family metallopeptidase [Cryobacterium gelidum]|uniref:M23 family metallopeptidase n=2 Tax=Cryobacterium gelidum TaxID=1259164 RepID=A0A4R9ATX0_9MICO|nr:M23 family metallopeptidase [Cryobacterium gelidum]